MAKRQPTLKRSVGVGRKQMKPSAGGAALSSLVATLLGRQG